MRFAHRGARLAAGICAALIALLFIALIGICVLLPRVAGEQVVGARLSELTQSTIGRGVEFRSLEIELFPPSVIAIGALVGDRSTPVASAERIELKPALAPLLAGVFVIDSAIVEGAIVHLVRTPREIALANAQIGSAARAARSDLAVRVLSLSGATITLEDRSIEPAAVWTLRDVTASVVAEVFGSQVRLELAGALPPTGRLVGKGEVAADGALQIELGFDALSIVAARPYFAAGSEVEGSLTGSLRVDGSIDRPAIELEATLRDARLRLGDIALRGNLDVEARIRDLRGAAQGIVELDATEAELGYAGVFTKAPGTSARVIGEVSTDPRGSLAIEAWRFVMQDLDGHVRAEPRDHFRLADRGPRVEPEAQPSGSRIR